MEWNLPPTMHTIKPYVIEPSASLLTMSTHKEISVYYHPEDSGEWAKYLQTNLGAQEYQIYTVLNDITSRLNMFLISSSFLELKNLNIIKGFDSHFSLALLMGVDMHDFTDAAQKWDLHDHIKEWVTFEVEEPEESVRNLLMKINSMYETDPDILSPYAVLSDVTDVIQEMTEQESKFKLNYTRLIYLFKYYKRHF